ncbi:MAG: DUF4240 domain-containing protein [Candidatus Levybacteria bacterium]|nr:DUF4240 domain-containing protein [Candidatus Levybacteria bacterium]
MALKQTNLTTSESLMDEDTFWQIIKSSKDKSENDFEEQKEQLANELRVLTADEIILFGNRFKFFRGEADTLELSGAFYIISGDDEVDSFNDFREWVIGLGKEFYHKITKDPQALVDIETDIIEEANWEGLGYTISTVFKEKTGQEMTYLFQNSDETKRKEWEEESHDLKNMFPKLYSKYPDNI